MTCFSANRNSTLADGQLHSPSHPTLRHTHRQEIGGTLGAGLLMRPGIQPIPTSALQTRIGSGHPETSSPSGRADAVPSSSRDAGSVHQVRMGAWADGLTAGQRNKERLWPAELHVRWEGGHIR